MDQDYVLPGTPWRVLGELGSGGQATVFKVEHVELRHVHAMKLLDVVSGEAATRMKVEWSALAKLRHDNVIGVVDAGESADGDPYFVMPLLEGETLDAILRRDGRLSLKRSLGLIAQILRGLSAVHREGIVHRDVKPANVFVTTDGVAKLIDFGYARTPLSSELSREGVVVGSPTYMSPEQAEGLHVDHRADVYAAALLLFEMLSGAQISPRSVGVQRDLREILAGTPRHVVDAIESALSKQPFRRPSSAAEFSAMLDDPSRGKPRRNYFTSGGLVMIGGALGFLAATQTAYGPRERLALAVGPAACQPVTVAPVMCPPPEPAVTVAAAAPGPRRSVARAAAPPPPAPVASTKPRYRSFADLTVDDLPPSGM